jgi:hypothetical protein
MFMPVFFFFSVFMEQVMHNNYFVENIFVRLDRINMGISAFMMMGFPAIAALINLKPLINLNVRKEGRRLSGNFSFTLRTLNVIIVLAAVVTLAVVAAYLLAENYRHP